MLDDTDIAIYKTKIRHIIGQNNRGVVDGPPVAVNWPNQMCCPSVSLYIIVHRYIHTWQYTI